MTMDELTRELLTWVSSRPRTYADVVEACLHGVRKRRHARVADRGRRALDGVGRAEDLLQQGLIVRLAFKVNQRFFDALQQLVKLGQEQRLIVGSEIELKLSNRWHCVASQAWGL